MEGHVMDFLRLLICLFCAIRVTGQNVCPTSTPNTFLWGTTCYRIIVQPNTQSGAETMCTQQTGADFHLLQMDNQGEANFIANLLTENNFWQYDRLFVTGEEDITDQFRWMSDNTQLDDSRTVTEYVPVTAEDRCFEEATRTEMGGPQPVLEKTLTDCARYCRKQNQDNVGVPGFIEYIYAGARAYVITDPWVECYCSDQLPTTPEHTKDGDFWQYCNRRCCNDTEVPCTQMEEICGGFMVDGSNNARAIAVRKIAEYDLVTRTIHAGYWNEGQPNNINDYQHCVAMKGTANYKWEDEFCSSQYGFICQIPHSESQCRDNGLQWWTEGGKCFEIRDRAEDSVNWYAASFMCQEVGGQLIKIDSEELHNHLVYLLSSLTINNFWIGLHKSTWKDNNGYDLRYTNFEQGRPSNGESKCLAINAFAQYKWQETNCNEVLPFICEALGVTGPSPPSVPTTRSTRSTTSTIRTPGSSPTTTVSTTTTAGTTPTADTHNSPKTEEPSSTFSGTITYSSYSSSTIEYGSSTTDLYKTETIEPGTTPGTTTTKKPKNRRTTTTTTKKKKVPTATLR